MSRIGRMPIKVPAGVKVEIKGSAVKVTGPKGTLAHVIPQGVVAKLANDLITVEISGEPEHATDSGALFGLTRSVLANLVSGVATGFSKELEIIGVGYRAAAKGNVLTLNVGYSHPIDYELPTGITAKVDANTKLTVSGADKTLVGMVAAKIRSFRAPEPYQGKGIKYANEHIVRKQGKAASGGK